MPRRSLKTKTRLAARLESFNNITNKEILSAQGLKFNKPGSQNRKK